MAAGGWPRPTLAAWALRGFRSPWKRGGTHLLQLGFSACAPPVGGPRGGAPQHLGWPSGPDGLALPLLLIAPQLAFPQAVLSALNASPRWAASCHGNCRSGSGCLESRPPTTLRPGAKRGQRCASFALGRPAKRLIAGSGQQRLSCSQQPRSHLTTAAIAERPCGPWESG